MAQEINLSHVMDPIQFTNGELIRLTDLLMETSVCHMPARPMRWVRCPICHQSHFTRLHTSIPIGICRICRSEVWKHALRRYIRNVYVYVTREHKSRVHTELIEFCTRPEYIQKTGLLETQMFFAS